MSEQRPKYIDDALQMIGKGYEPAAIIEEPRRRLVMGGQPGFEQQDSAAWVKLSTAFKAHIKELRGAPLAVWLYLSLSINREGIAFPGIRTMAAHLGYSHQGVLDAIKTLEEKGYLTVSRGEKRYNIYKPEFAANGKGNEPVNLLDSSSVNESSFSPNESSGLDSNKNNKIKNKRECPIMKALGEFKIKANPAMTGITITEWQSVHADEWIIKAIQMAQGNHINYADRILQTWEEKGYPPERKTPPERQADPAPAYHNTEPEDDPEEENRMTYKEYQAWKAAQNASGN
jgi:hypothetical protein